MNIHEIRTLIAPLKGKYRLLSEVSGVPAPTIYKITATKTLPDGTKVFLRSDIKTETADSIVKGCKVMRDIEKLKIKREPK